MSADWLIDLGHSRAKWARAENGQLLIETIGSCMLAELDQLNWRLKPKSGDRIWLSGQSRREAVNTISTWGHRCRLSLHPVSTGALDLPVQAAYPQLGTDRWLALQWPWLHSPQASCIVDAGTAVTVDLIDGQGRHQGGWIMAGMDSARAGLLSRAPGLPDRPGDIESPQRPAVDSADAISRGAVLQLCGAVERCLDQAESFLGQAPQIWFTGGDASVLRQHLPDRLLESSQHDEHLVLRGLALATRQA